MELLTVRIFSRPILTDILLSYTSPTILLSSIFLLNIFSDIKLNNKMARVTAYLAPAAFGVYLIHCHPVILDIFIPKICNLFLDMPAVVILLFSLILILVIYVTCSIIDILRKFLFKLIKIDTLSDFISKLFKKIFSPFFSEDAEQ